MPPATHDESLRFGHFEIRPAERLLRIDGQDVAVGARAFDVLLAMAQRRERLVTKQELLDLVWPGVVVEQHNIATQISTLRKLLGPQVIATVPGRGYRFIAPAPEGSVRSAGDVVAAPAPSAHAAVAAVLTRLTHQLTPLLGRDDDLAALGALVQQHRLVTLTGAGGIGKSLLAQHLLQAHARDYRDGVCWVELASTSDPLALPARIAEALGVRAGAGDPLAGLCSAVAPLTMLVALDNAEHLLAAVGEAAAALRAAAPGLRLLVTSQAPLQVADEHVYRLGPLAVPHGPLLAAQAQTFGAIALFVERACAADARFVLSDLNARAAIDLCRQLDGLPLGIELAAARAPLLGVAQLAASMQDRLKLLTHNRNSAAPSRQQTLRAALEWSHGFLDENERTVFRRLSVMADSASLAFIQQVVADAQGPLDSWVALDTLGTLVERSLVVALFDDPEEPRYRLLESPRLFALEQLRAADEEQTLRRRHAAALAVTFDAAWHERWSGRIDARKWAGRVLRDASNARDAIAWARGTGENDIAASIATTLFAALPKWSHFERAALTDLCEALAERVAAPLLRLRAWDTALRLIHHRNQQQLLDLAARALALARELDRTESDRWTLYRTLTLWIKAAAVVSHVSVDALHAALAELAALEDPRWPPHRLTRGLEAMRLARLRLGGPDQAAESLLLTRRVVAGLEAEGEDTAEMLGALIDAELTCGQTDEAVRLGERVLEQLAETHDELTRTMVRTNLAAASLALGDTARARALLEVAWPATLQWNLHVLASDYPALLAGLEGRTRTAARLAGYADAAHAARDLTRHPLEATARERSHALARVALGDVMFERLLAEGRELRDEQIASLAFATEDSG